MNHRSSADWYEGPGTIVRTIVRGKRLYHVSLDAADRQPAATLALWHLADAGVSPEDGVPVTCRASLRARGWAIEELKPVADRPTGVLEQTGKSLAWGTIQLQLEPHCPPEIASLLRSMWSDVARKVPFFFVQGNRLVARVDWETLSRASSKALASWQDAKAWAETLVPKPEEGWSLSHKGDALTVGPPGTITLVARDQCRTELRRKGDPRWTAVAAKVPFEKYRDDSARISWERLSSMHALEPAVNSWKELAERCAELAAKEQPPIAVAPAPESTPVDETAAPNDPGDAPDETVPALERRLRSLFAVMATQPSLLQHYDDLARVFARTPAALVDAVAWGEMAQRFRDAAQKLNLGSQPPAAAGTFLAKGLIAARLSVGLNQHALAAPLVRLHTLSWPEADSDRRPLRLLDDDPDTGLLGVCHQWLRARTMRLASVELKTALASQHRSSPLFWELRYVTQAAAARQTVVVLAAIRPHSFEDERAQDRLVELLDGSRSQQLVLLVTEQRQDTKVLRLDQINAHRQANLHVIADVGALSDVPVSAEGVVRRQIVNTVREFPIDHIKFIHQSQLVTERSFRAAGELTRFLSEQPGEIAQLYSMRKSGKSTFCFDHLRRNHAGGFVYLNLQYFKETIRDFIMSSDGASFDDPLAKLVAVVTRTFSTSQQRNLAPVVSSADDLDLAAPSVAVILDEIEAVGDGWDGEAVPERRIARFLAALSSSHPTIVIGLDPWWHLSALPDDHAIRLRAPLSFALFQPRETQSLCDRMLDYQCEVPLALGEWLWARTGGHPTVVRYLFDQIVTFAIDRQLIEWGGRFEVGVADEWWKVHHETLDYRACFGIHLPNFFQKLRRAPIGSYRNRLWTLVRLVVQQASDDRNASLARVRELFRTQDTGVFEEALQAAIMTNFVVHDGDSLRLSIPLLHDWLARDGEP
jgi:hypothetical protein